MPTPNAYKFSAADSSIYGMILSCPSCATRYLVDDSQIGSTGRTVRCAKCRHSWHQDPPEEITEPVSVVEPPQEPAPIPKGSNLPALPKEKSKKGGRWIGWVAFALTIAVILGGGYLTRHQIVELWPPSARLFTMIDPSISFPYVPGQSGTKSAAKQPTKKAEPAQPKQPDLPVGAGLNFVNVKPTFKTENQKQVLIVSGRIKNLSKVAKKIPRVRISLVDASQREIHYWIFPVDAGDLQPGKSVPFRTQLVDPPSNLAGLNAKFIGDNEATSQN